MTVFSLFFFSTYQEKVEKTLTFKCFQIRKLISSEKSVIFNLRKIKGVLLENTAGSINVRQLKIKGTYPSLAKLIELISSLLSVSIGSER